MYKEDNSEYRIIDLDSDEFIAEDGNFNRTKYDKAYNFISLDKISIDSDYN